MLALDLRQEHRNQSLLAAPPTAVGPRGDQRGPRVIVSVDQAPGQVLGSLLDHPLPRPRLRAFVALMRELELALRAGQSCLAQLPARSRDSASCSLHGGPARARRQAFHTSLPCGENAIRSAVVASAIIEAHRLALPARRTPSAEVPER
jgi:hypothetical protein